MIDGAAGIPPSLRERKRQRTRVQLVSAAVELSRRHGFAQATIEQIAAAVDVSPRTFSRYFPTKEAAILSVVQDMADTAQDYLVDVDPEMEPLDALVAAHQMMFDDVHRGRHGVTPSLLAGALLVIGESTVLRPLALGLTPVGLLHAVARRMGAGPDHSPPWLVMRLWLTILSCASREAGIAVAFGQCDASLTARVLSERVTAVRAQMTTLVPRVPD
ncbi:TetR/AcrR family transcriptional regulator [Mycobacterium yunnanensis]|uniref:TetR/AcrR family transcriptional regulator n=1 Tax=Mycobacterium yunnanensis TaxID=368477 RepID=A0A9X3C485_9MYCO|nr:TetR/AcrR family transcriptional regulator [Mycobacterium yunnanensis]